MTRDSSKFKIQKQIATEEDKHPAIQRKLTNTERKEMIAEIRRLESDKSIHPMHRATAEIIINDVLLDVQKTDPLLTLSDVRLIALNATIQKAIKCYDMGLMWDSDKAMLTKKHRYLKAFG